MLQHVMGSVHVWSSGSGLQHQFWVRTGGSCCAATGIRGVWQGLWLDVHHIRQHVCWPKCVQLNHVCLRPNCKQQLRVWRTGGKGGGDGRCHCR
jgi:hypothetical protein